MRAQNEDVHPAPMPEPMQSSDRALTASFPQEKLRERNVPKLHTQSPAEGPALSGESEKGKSSVIKPRDDQRREEEDRDGLVEWVASVVAENWFGIARWAKEQGLFMPWERSLLFNIGRYVANSWRVSTRQARQGKRLYDRALELGFSPDRDVRK